MYIISNIASRAYYAGMLPGPSEGFCAEQWVQ